MFENVRLVINHSCEVDDSVRGSRSRNIASIFLECDGERFRFPHNSLTGARAMAYHMSQGGKIYDKVGEYVIENTEYLSKLKKFNRYINNNNLINESNKDIADTLKENLSFILSELRNLTSKRTYETVCARINTKEKSELKEDDVSSLRDMFTKRVFDTRFEEVLPIVNHIVQEKQSYMNRIEESSFKPVMIRRITDEVLPMFEFATKNASFGYKLSGLSKSIVENDELSKFVESMSNKVTKGEELNIFEKKIIKNILENSKYVEIPEKKESAESKLVESIFSKFDVKFF
jgi:hypothetical protein